MAGDSTFWFETSSRFPPTVLIGVLLSWCLLAAQLQHAPFSVAQEAAIPSELTAGPFQGVDFELLASRPGPEEIFEPWTSEMVLTRWQMPPGDERVVLAVDLAYVEEGAIVAVDAAGTESAYAKGNSFVPVRSQTVLRNEGPGCAWVLLAQFLPLLGATTSTDEAGPNFGGGIPCDVPENVLARAHLGMSLNSRAPEGLPGFLFIARKIWSAPGGIHRYSGPVVIAVESGELNIGAPGHLAARLGPGASITIEPGAPFFEGVDQFGTASALVIGWLDAASQVPESTSGAIGTQGLSADASRFESASFGWSLSWDLSWAVLEGNTGDGWDRLRLGNGVSEVSFSTDTTEDAHAIACVERIRSNRTWLEPATDNAGSPLVQGNEQSYAAVFIDASGEVELVSLVQCTHLGATGGMLEMSWSVPVGDYNAALPSLEALLAGLQLPP